jgi:endonuclease/exonuclease/phosphatase family metal-dependent hydrolase
LIRSIQAFGWAAAATLAGCTGLTRAPASETVRVLVYNIHAGKDAAGVDNLERVAAIVRETNADIVLLQEVDRGTERSGRTDQPTVLARLAAMHVAFGSALDYQGGKYGIAILSRWPIVAETLIHLPVDPPQQRSGGSYEPRGALRVSIRRNSGPLVVINTHLDASREDVWRRQEIRTILAIADTAMHAFAGPVLVGGDFNSTPDSEVQRILRTFGLRDSWLECGRGDGYSYPADSSIKRIDYLYQTRGSRCLDARVLATQASDHRPVLFTLRL